MAKIRFRKWGMISVAEGNTACVSFAAWGPGAGPPRGGRGKFPLAPAYGAQKGEVKKLGRNNNIQMYKKKGHTSPTYGGPAYGAPKKAGAVDCSYTARDVYLFLCFSIS